MLKHQPISSSKEFFLSRQPESIEQHLNKATPIFEYLIFFFSINTLTVLKHVFSIYGALKNPLKLIHMKPINNLTGGREW